MSGWALFDSGSEASPMDPGRGNLAPRCTEDRVREPCRGAVPAPKESSRRHSVGVASAIPPRMRELVPPRVLSPLSRLLGGRTRRVDRPEARPSPMARQVAEPTAERAYLSARALWHDEHLAGADDVDDVADDHSSTAFDGHEKDVNLGVHVWENSRALGVDDKVQVQVRRCVRPDRARSGLPVQECREIDVCGV